MAKEKKKSNPQKKTGGAFSLNSKLAFGILFALAFFLYANTLGHQYALDDRAVTFANKFVQKGFGGFGEIMTTFYWKGFWDANANLYRPMSLLVFAAEWQLSPGSTKLLHFTNVFLYALTSVLLFRLLLKMLGEKNQLVSFIAVLLFIVHPMHTEVVANIKSLDEILSLLFFILSMGQLLKYAEQPKPLQLGAAALLFYCALLSKEGAVLFFPVMALALWYFTQTPVKKIAVAMAPLALVAVLWFLQHQWVIGQDAAPAPYNYQNNSLLATGDVLVQKATATGMLGRYLFRSLFPYPLSYDYSYPEIPNTGFGDPVVLLSLAAAAGLLYLAVRGLRSKTIVSFGIWWFFITIALTSNIFYIIGASMADRFLFVPSLGFCLAAAWLITRYTGGLSAAPGVLHHKTLTASLVLAVPYLLITFNRNPDWYDDATLFTADVESAPGSSRVHYNYGTLMMDNGNKETDPLKKQNYYSEAEKALRESLRLDTLFGTHNSAANLGVVCYREGKYAESAEATRLAIRKFKAAIEDMIRQAPENQKDSLRKANFGNTYSENLCDAYGMLKQNDSLIAFATRTLEDNQLVTRKTRLYLAMAYLNSKDTATSLATFGEAVRKDSSYAEAWEKYGNVLGMSGRYNESIRAMEKTYALDPSKIDALRIIAVNYGMMRDTVKMQQYLQRFVQAGGVIPK